MTRTTRPESSLPGAMFGLVRPRPLDRCSLCSGIACTMLGMPLGAPDLHSEICGANLVMGKPRFVSKDILHHHCYTYLCCHS